MSKYACTCFSVLGCVYVRAKKDKKEVEREAEKERKSDRSRSMGDRGVLR